MKRVIAFILWKLSGKIAFSDRLYSWIDRNNGVYFNDTRYIIRKVKA